MALELPIHAVRGALVAALGQARPIVITAPTGSGKSTCLPSWIAAACGGPVLVVEPRRVACRALALYVARQAGERLGDRVGYRVRFDDKTSARTELCFVTPGVALNLAGARNDELGAYAALMLDEFHERSWELDLLVALARRRAGPRLIVCSATLAVEGLVRELDATLLEAEGRSFPVEIEYEGEDAPSERGLEVRVAVAVERALARADGEILVFLPGKGEIERCAAELARRRCAAPIIAVHGGVPPKRIVDLFAAAGREGGGSRVFLATNVAESSLTLPGVRTVIDSGLARMRLHRGGRSVLALNVIARDSMDQRAGRAGRVAPGRCVRLWSRAFVPREVTTPELERIELDDLILRAAGCGLDANELEAAPWIDRPPSFALAAARERLARVGALDGDGRVNAHGRSLARLPVAGRQARILLGAPPELAGAVADLVALLEYGRALWLRCDGPGSAEVEEAREELADELPPGQRDEVHGALWGLRRGDPRRHGLHRAGLSEVRRLADSLRAQIGAPPLADERDTPLPGPGRLAAFLLTRVPETAFVRRPRGERGRRSSRDPSTAWANGEIELLIRETSAPGVRPDARDPAPSAGLILDHEWIGAGRSARGRGRMLLPCALEQLAAAGLGEVELCEPKVELAAGVVATIEATRELRLAGVRLARRRRALTGSPLRATLATMIVEGRRLPPLTRELRHAVLDELHLWELLARAIEGPLAGRVAAIRAAPPAEVWLSERLAVLGLEDAAELALLADEDLRPRPAALDQLAEASAALGEREWTLDALAQDFPRVVSERGAHYGCEVRFDRKRVTLEPLDALARKRGEPRVEQLPRFRGFRLVYRQASRRVVLRQ
ncbi:ATP-dependent RNA helicase HrpB [Enhygromyxa salina]|uniref:ATP-dependent RNA helicase HrpB n=1 Tax=Enhygromyxa salina TaxID=215803 RepID=A0A2S9YK70_9BACT|nr:helicase-related protein [Enhygromyxa salina]PRQ05494.1 ATP-dependent RNA helicase HrpB [Enhygromyxa salina]